jgi:hypothetical protein
LYPFAYFLMFSAYIEASAMVFPFKSWLVLLRKIEFTVKREFHGPDDPSQQ